MIYIKFGTPGCGRNTHYKDLKVNPNEKFIMRDVVIEFNKDGSIKSCDYELSDEQLKRVLFLRRHGNFDILTIKQMVRKVSKFEMFMYKIKSLFRRNYK